MMTRSDEGFSRSGAGDDYAPCADHRRTCANDICAVREPCRKSRPRRPRNFDGSPPYLR